MQVLKFGGTSVGSVENMKRVANIIQDSPGKKVVVLSAMAGTTNTLLQLSSYIEESSFSEAKELVDRLEQKYHQVVFDLYEIKEFYAVALKFITDRINVLRECISPQGESETTKNLILAQGELLSTYLFSLYLSSIEVKNNLLPALEFMKMDNKKDVDPTRIALYINQSLEENISSDIFITQGFIAKDHQNNISNLDRGGSDYTASLIGAAIKAEEIQIWTDIDGMHNNDPRFVENTYSIPEIGFEEAAELAYFGAKILHPQSVIPAMENNIPVRLKNTFNPSARGTKIFSDAPKNRYSSIAAKDGIIAIRIKSYRMLMAYGFLKTVFEIFERHKTPIDMITTSEVAVSLTIDNKEFLEEIVNELSSLGKVEVDLDQTIICVAGNFDMEETGVNVPILDALSNVPIRMISFGGSKYNVSVLINSGDKIDALNALNNNLFNPKKHYMME